MTTLAAPRASTLPVGPLLEAAERHAHTLDPLAALNGPHHGGAFRPDGRPSDRLLGLALGVTPQAVWKLRHRGTVNHWTADRYATALGVHPAVIWGDLWWTGTCLEDGAA